MSKDARIIITYKCNRKCPGCANTYSSVMSKAQSLTSVKQLKDYDNLVISGGEPMLFPDRVTKIAKILKKAVPQAKIFLYTALNRGDEIERILPYIDGINFTVHDNPGEKDIMEFHSFQAMASRWRNKSFRLYATKSTAENLHIIPSIWSRVKLDPWMSEDDMVKAGGCPEDLFVLTKDKRPASTSDIKDK